VGLGALGLHCLDGLKRLNRSNWSAIGCRVPIALLPITSGDGRRFFALLQDANPGAWYTAAVCAFAIVTRAWQLQRVFCCNCDKSMDVLSLVIAFCAILFLKLKLRIAALDFKRSC
jgi:hypothetical protein